MAEEEKENSQQKQAEKIKMLATLLGGEDAGPQTEEILAMMEMAENLRPLFMQDAQEETEKETAKALPEPFTPTREVRLLRAAMPFLDNQYQKTIYVLTKAMEIRQAGEQKTLQIASEEGGKRSKGKPAALLRAIQPYLLEHEQRQVESILKLYKMREMMKLMQILSKEDGKEWGNTTKY